MSIVPRAGKGPTFAIRLAILTSLVDLATTVLGGWR